MAKEFAITDEMRRAIGNESPPWTYEVTTTSVRAFARGVGYTDPVYFDVATAQQAGYRSLPAPPTYLGTPVFVPGRSHDVFSVPTEGQPTARHGLKGLLDGGTETGWTTVLRSQDDAFPAVNPRPRAPELILRSWTVKPTSATHVMLKVRANQCTGQPSYQGEQDADPGNVEDCRTGGPSAAGVVLPPRNTEVHAAELQVLAGGVVRGENSAGINAAGWVYISPGACPTNTIQNEGIIQGGSSPTFGGGGSVSIAYASGNSVINSCTGQILGGVPGGAVGISSRVVQNIGGLIRGANGTTA